MAPFQELHSRNGAADVFGGIGGGGNLTTLSIGWAYVGERHGLNVELFDFTATENDSQVEISGDDGLPGDFDEHVHINGEDDLGTELDIIYTYQVNEYFGFEAGVALFQPGDAFEIDFGTDDDVTRLWGQARLRF